MKKGILKNLAKIIVVTAVIIISIVIDVCLFLLLSGLFDYVIKESPEENRQEYIEVLDEKTKRIEDTGLTLQELTDEDVDSNLSKSEIDGYYIFKFNKMNYEVSIYFDNEENIVSVQTAYCPECGWSAEEEENEFILKTVLILLIVIAFAVFMLLIGMEISIIKDPIGEIIETIKEMKQELEE